MKGSEILQYADIPVKKISKVDYYINFKNSFMRKVQKEEIFTRCPEVGSMIDGYLS